MADNFDCCDHTKFRKLRSLQDSALMKRLLLCIAINIKEIQTIRKPLRVIQLPKGSPSTKKKKKKKKLVTLMPKNNSLMPNTYAEEQMPKNNAEEKGKLRLQPIE